MCTCCSANMIAYLGVYYRMDCTIQSHWQQVSDQQYSVMAWIWWNESRAQWGPEKFFMVHKFFSSHDDAAQSQWIIFTWKGQWLCHHLLIGQSLIQNKAPDHCHLRYTTTDKNAFVWWLYADCIYWSYDSKLVSYATICLICTLNKHILTSHFDF